MKEISFDEVIDELMVRLKEKYTIPLPRRLIKKFIKKFVTTFFRTVNETERIIDTWSLPIVKVMEIHDGSKYLYRFIDTDETKMMSTKDVQLYKDALSMEQLTICVNKKYGTRKKIFRNGRHNQSTTVHNIRHYRYGAFIRDSYKKRNRIPITDMEKEIKKASLGIYRKLYSDYVPRNSD